MNGKHRNTDRRSRLPPGDEKVVKSLTDEVNPDRMVFGTLRGRIMDGSRQTDSQTFGAIAKWFVYALTVLAAANVLAIELLSQWRQTAVSFLSVFAVG